MPKAVGVELTHAPDVPQKLYGLLTWAVQRGHRKPIDAPPTTLLETLKPKCIGYPLSDAQIQQLLANRSLGEAHDRLRFAIQPCAVYRLRPEELRHLPSRTGQTDRNSGRCIRSRWASAHYVVVNA